MAKLYFYYAAMNAGKSTTLLQADFNYRERGMETMLWTAAHRRPLGRGHDRLAHRPVGAGAHAIRAAIDLFDAVADEADKRRKLALRAGRRGAIPDPRPGAPALPRSADELGIPGALLRPAHRFPGAICSRVSAALLALADALVELKAVCECGRKATMNLRVDAEGHAVAAGAQTEIGGNDRYVALCRRHFFERLREGEARQLSLGLARAVTLAATPRGHEPEHDLSNRRLADAAGDRDRLPRSRARPGRAPARRSDRRRARAA